MSFDHLAPKIRQILSAPDTDLSTVSAKHVRKQLLELDPEITLEFIKENKKAIDHLITGIFEGMNNPQAGVGVGVAPAHTVTANGNGKRKREEDEGQEEASDEGRTSEGEDERDNVSEEDEPERSSSPATPAPKKQKKAKVKAGLTDEEYAKQLSSELNQRPSRAGRKSNGTSKKGSSRTPKKFKKSRAQIDDDSDVGEDNNGEGSSRKRKHSKVTKKSGGGGAKGGFQKEFALSEPLAALMQTPQLSRPQVVKKLWEYIKGHELQNPKNKKEILCDDALRAVFSADKIDMFGMNKTLGQHFYELES